MITVEEVLGHCETLAASLPAVVQGGLEKIEQTTKISRAKVIAGGLGFCAVYMIFGYFAQFVCNFVGFAIPAYWSMKAIESSTKADDTRWLTYWVVFACFTCFDFFADGIFAWFPFYWLAKIIFLIYCFLPTPQNGSEMIYQKLIRPMFMKHEGAIDAGAKHLANAVSNATKTD